MGAIVPSTTPARRSTVLEATVDDDVVLLAEHDARYHGLDAMGARVWALVDGERSVADICEALTADFEVDPERCRTEVVAFLADLADHGLIDV